MIGYDTAVRLVAPRYYARQDGPPGEDTVEMLLQVCFANFVSLHCLQATAPMQPETL